MEISRCVRANLSACVSEKDDADFDRGTLALGFGLLRGLEDEWETFFVLTRLTRLAFFFFFLPAAAVVVLLPALVEAENVNAICFVVERVLFAILPSWKMVNLLNPRSGGPTAKDRSQA